MYKRLTAALLLLILPLSALAKTPDDTYFFDQWYLDKISVETAWDQITGDHDVVIAVLDTGVDLNHPDLAENLWKNINEIPNNDKDDDGNGFIDDYDGWDFVDSDGNPEPEVNSSSAASTSHGTFISGLIAAETNNGYGYAGVLWSAQIMPLRVLNSEGTGDDLDTASAIDYAVANGAKVINMSFAGNVSTGRLATAVKKAYEAGVVVVAALGNDGRNVDESPVYPACLRSEDEDWVLGVTATDQLDGETDFTNYGLSCADISAPGEYILGLNYQDKTVDSAFGGPWNGTSTASPLVAGAAGLLLAKYPSLSPADVFTVLKLSVDPVEKPASGAGSLGVGRVNLAHALELGASFVQAVDSVDSVDAQAPVGTLSNSSQSVAPADKTNSYVVLGAGAGALPNVSVYKGSGSEYAIFPAYAPNFSGGVRVAAGDLDGDAIPEVVTGAGPGGGPHVRVFKPYGAVISEFFAYDARSSQGVSVALGDTNGDGIQEIVTAVGAGVTNDIVIWNQAGQAQSLFTAKAFDSSAPLMVTTGQLDNDPEAEIIVFAASGQARVAAYDSDGTELLNFLAFSDETDGVQVDAADLDGDGKVELVATAGTGNSTRVRTLSSNGAYVNEFNLSEPSGVGINLSLVDIDLDGQVEIVTIPSGSGQASVLTVEGIWIKYLADQLVKVAGSYLATW